MHYRQNAMLKTIQCLFVLALTALALVCLLPSPAHTQTTADEPQQDTLATLVPADAVFYLERAGHTAVREAFLASNFGELAMDDAVYQFVQSSRVRAGELIMRSMFELEDEEEIAKYQQTLHEMLKPFWYEPAAMFVIVRDGQPKLGFICRTREYFSDCQQAVDTLMAFGVPAIGRAGDRQKFTFEHAGIVWEGVAKGYSDWVLPENEQDQLLVLADKSLFMVHWADDTLFMALDLDAARSISEVVASQGTDAAVDISKAGNENFQAVMARTVIEQWAFKWYADIEAIKAQVQEISGGAEGTDSPVLTILGVDAIVGVGGTGGYVDNVYARKTYIYAPDALGGAIQLFKRGGSYERGLAMTPDTASVLLAGQLDTGVLLSMVRQYMLSTQLDDATEPVAPVNVQVGTLGGSGSADIELVADMLDDPTDQPPELTGKAAEFMDAVEQLLGASDGNFTAFVGDMSGILASFATGSIPAAIVLDVTDQQRAAEAVETLMALAHMPLSDSSDAQGAPSVYRNVPIFSSPQDYGPSPSVAVMEDRIVLAFSDNAIKAAIDAAIDYTGGFPVNSRGDDLAALAGDGPVIFAMDLAAMARAFWPMLMQMASNAYMGESFPLTDLPSAGKLARLLGHEVAVFKPDDEGLLLDSRGQVPLATKIVPLGPFVAYPLMYLMMF